MSTPERGDEVEVDAPDERRGELIINEPAEQRLIVVNRELVRLRRKRSVTKLVGGALGLSAATYIGLVVLMSLTMHSAFSTSLLLLPFVLIPTVAWLLILRVERRSSQQLKYLGSSGKVARRSRLEMSRSIESLEAERQHLLERVGVEKGEQDGEVTLLEEETSRGALSVERSADE